MAEEIGIRLSVRGRREAARALADTASDVGKVDRKLDGVSGSSRRAERALDRASRAGSAFGRNVAKGAAIGAAALVGIGYGAFRLGSSLVSEAKESAKIGRLTEAAIASTGGAANLTADQIGKLAETLSNKTAIDDEAIQSGMNMLLSFSQVRDEVGKGNDIFTQASALALDYSVRTGTDAVAANVALGKALNDPIKGVTALSKAGVSFTDQQRKQIKTLVESGKVLEAQKVILAAVGENFAGSAQAAADPTERLRVIVGNLGERVGGMLLPSVERFANYVADQGVPVVHRFLDQFDRGVGLGGQFRDKLEDLRAKAVQLWEEFRTGTGTGGDLRASLETAGAAAMILGTAAHTYVLPALKWLGEHPDVLKGVVAGMVALKVATWGAATAQLALNAAQLAGFGKGAAGKGPLATLLATARRWAPKALKVAKFGGPIGVAIGLGATVYGPDPEHVIQPGDPWAPPSGQGGPQTFPNLVPGPRVRQEVAPQVAPQVSLPGSSGDRRSQTIVVQTVLDGRVVAENTTDHIYSQEARR